MIRSLASRPLRTNISPGIRAKRISQSTNSRCSAEYTAAMDFRAPETSMYSFKDFAIHILAATCGILIAPGLEGIRGEVHHQPLKHAIDTAGRAASNQKESGARNQSDLCSIKPGNDFVFWELSIPNVLPYSLV